MYLQTFCLLAVSVVPSVWAQVNTYGQCGGINYSGSTTCVAGSVCTKYNDYYSQCIPGTVDNTTPQASTTSSTSAPIASGTATGKFWFSFGDSYTQTGFTVTGAQPSTSNALGNPGYPGYTACGSVPNWIDYAAFTMNSSFVAVYNHAYGGATIDASLVTPYTSTVLSLVDQTNNFLQYNAPGKQYHGGWSSSNALFSVWIGINDIGNTYWNSGEDAFLDKLLNRYFELITQMYNVGARHFLFLTVPPIYRSPLMLAQSSSAQSTEKTVIDTYNTRLAAKAAAFASANPGVTAQIYDTGPIVNDMLNKPSSYGLKDATSYGSGDNVAWCNDYHISPKVHQQIAKGVAALVGGTYI